MPAKNVVLALSAGTLVAASATVATWAQAPTPHAAMAGPAAPTKAVAVLYPTKGSEVKGTVTFTAASGGVHVQATVHGLTDGPHGFRIHEFGDTSAADGTSAGGHFNPMKEPHAAPTSPMRHVGDLGNIESEGRRRHPRHDRPGARLHTARIRSSAAAWWFTRRPTT